MNSRIFVSRLALALSIILFIGIFYQFYIDGTLKNDRTLILLLGTFGFMSISDKIMAVLWESDAVKNENIEKEEAKKTRDLLPSLFSGRNDIVTFSNSTDSMQYCIAVCPLAVEVKNTVLRYGLTNSISPSSPIYSKWIDVKKKSILEGNCVWKELVSSSFLANDPQIEFIRIFNTGSSNYNAVFIDDTKHHIIQMTIISFRNGSREIIFGHEFPVFKHGPSFMTKNSEVIRYFEGCFEHWAATFGKEL